MLRQWLKSSVLISFKHWKITKYHYCEIDGLAEHYSIHEFTIYIHRLPNDDASEESSSELSTAPGSFGDPIDDGDFMIWFFKFCNQFAA